MIKNIPINNAATKPIFTSQPWEYYGKCSLEKYSKIKRIAGMNNAIYT